MLKIKIDCYIPLGERNCDERCSSNNLIMCQYLFNNIESLN